MSRPPLLLHTSSLSLRPFVLEDTGQLFLLSNEPAYRTWLPNQLYETEADARSAIAFLISKYSVPGDPRLGPYVLAVLHREDRVLIGHVGFSPLGDDVEIGFAIGERYQRRGLATEAVFAASRWALEAFALTRLLGITSIENIASKSTLLRAQFSHQEDRDMMFQGVEQRVSIYVSLP